MADPQPVRMRRRSVVGVLGVLCAIALGGPLTGCGGEEEPDRAEPAALDTARLTKIKRLNSEQYEAIKRVYAASEDLKSTDNSGLDFDVVVADLLDACEGRGGGDPLLTPVLASCAELVRFQTAAAAVGPCVGTDVCTDLYDAARARVQAYGLSMRLSDEAVKATRLPRACKRVFVYTKSDYAQARRYDRAIDTLQAATRTPSTTDDAIAARRFVRVNRAAGSPSTFSSRELKRVRRHCPRRA